MDISNSDFQSLADRVEKLEEQYRSLKSEVVAEKFVLVDADGKTRATLVMFEEKGPRLDLYDTDGNPCASLVVSAEGPALWLTDAKTKQSMSLRASEGSQMISLTGANGSVMVTAGASGAAIYLDANGGPSVRVTSMPSIDLLDANGQARLSLDVLSFDSRERGLTTVPSLTMLDPNGRASVVVRALENRPSVCLLDAKNPDGNTSVQITVRSDEPNLVCGKDGKVLWSAP